MSTSTLSIRDNKLSRAIGRLIKILESVPYSALAIPLRVAVAYVFWSSYQEHVANWDTTLYLFESEYKVPLLPPATAACLAAAIEFLTPILLTFGFCTRGAALILLLMTAVIEVFVYPQAWPTHIQWASMLLVLLCRGPGAVSIDHLVSKALLKAAPAR